MRNVQKADLTKLINILGLLGSDHDGERAAAALAAHRFVTSNGHSWAALLTPPTTEQPTSGMRGSGRGVRTVVAYPFADTVAAAEARLRQMRTENDRLRQDNRRLRQKLAEERTPKPADMTDQ
jgi:hypothetical protein